MQRLTLQMYNYTNSQAPSMQPPPPPPPSFFEIGHASPPPLVSPYHQPSASSSNYSTPPPVSPYHQSNMSYTPESPPLNQQRDNFDDDTIDVNDGPEYFDVMNLRRRDEENQRALDDNISRADHDAYHTVEQARSAIESRRDVEESEVNESIEVVNEENMEVDVNTNANANDIDYDDNANDVDDEIEASTDSANEEVSYIVGYHRAAAEGLVQLSVQRPRTSPVVPPPTPEPLPLPPGIDALPHTAQQTPPTTRPPTPRPFPRLSRSIARHEQIRLEQQRAIAAQLPRPLCGICKDDLLSKSPMTLPCNHVFCSECIREMIPYQPSCPVCREIVPSIDWCDFVFFP